MRRRARAAALCVSVVLGLGAAWADTPPPDETLLGDMGGLRPRLERAGLTLGLQETSQLTRLVSGGLQGGSAYTGLTQLALAGDGDKAWGWSGGSFYLSAVNIHGRRASFTQDNVGERLSMRDFLMGLREVGQELGGPAPYARKDRERIAATVASYQGHFKHAASARLVAGMAQRFPWAGLTPNNLSIT